MRNVITRLKLYYGSNSYFHVDSSDALVALGSIGTRTDIVDNEKYSTMPFIQTATEAKKDSATAFWQRSC